MARIVHPQFRDENTYSKYPFTDLSSLVSDTGEELPRDALIDAVLHPVGLSQSLVLLSVTIDGLTASFSIGHDSEELCSGSIDLSGQNGAAAVVDGLGRPAGVLLFNPGTIATIQGWQNGVHSFGRNATFVPTVVIPSPEVAVRGLGAESDVPLVNDVWIVGEDGVLVTDDNGDIRIDIVGDPLWRRAVCDRQPDFQSPNFALTINGTPPDDYGNWRLVTGRALTPKPALRVRPENGVLIIELALPGG